MARAEGETTTHAQTAPQGGAQGGPQGGPQGGTPGVKLQIEGGTALGSTLATLNPIAAPLPKELDWVRVTGPQTPGLSAEQREINERSAAAQKLIEGGDAQAGLIVLAELAHENPETPHLTRNFFAACLRQESYPMTKAALRATAHGLRSSHASSHTACNVGNKYALGFFRASENENGVIDLYNISDDRFEVMLALLTCYRVQFLANERMFIRIRKRVLQILDSCFAQAVETPPRAPELAEAFAMHAFENEYLWDEDAEETAILERLTASVHKLLAMNEPVPAPILFIIGAYRPLERDPTVRNWVAGLARVGRVDPTLAELVLNRLIEEQVADRLPSLTDIGEGVSSAVRSQYEENPYPRWRHLPTPRRMHFVDVIRASLRGDVSRVHCDVRSPAVLIAGSGTGQSAISVARTYSDATVVGVDLSRASLAYGTRMAAKLGVDNLTFAHADILKLAGLEDRFDVVDASGVLHHMKDIEEGLRAVLRTLKPGGYGHFGLYSTIARRDVAACRDIVAERGFSSDLKGLRAFRRVYLAEFRDKFPSLWQWRDFFAASELRDLVFHVQEHTVTIPEIATLLERTGVEFLGFKHSEADVLDNYAAAYPDDVNQTDLDNWAEFEEQNPSTFSAMYQFWVRKPD